jgi:hypothetical protein
MPGSRRFSVRARGAGKLAQLVDNPGERLAELRYRLRRSERPMHVAKRTREAGMLEHNRVPTAVFSKLGLIALRKQLGFEVEHAIRVAARRRGLTGVDGVGRDQEDAPRRRDVRAALEVKAGRAPDDVSDRQRVVHVRRVAMIDKGCVERLDSR